MTNYYFVCIDHKDGDKDRLYVHADQLEAELERVKGMFPDSEIKVVAEDDGTPYINME
jgi:hypothetical protein